MHVSHRHDDCSGRYAATASTIPATHQDVIISGRFFMMSQLQRLDIDRRAARGPRRGVGLQSSTAEVSEMEDWRAGCLPRCELFVMIAANGSRHLA